MIFLSVTFTSNYIFYFPNKLKSLKVIEHLKVTFELSMTIRKVHIHYYIST